MKNKEAKILEFISSRAFTIELKLCLEGSTNSAGGVW